MAGPDQRLRGGLGGGAALRSRGRGVPGAAGSLRYFNVGGNLRSLLVVSPEAEDGKSTVAACLATTLAQRGDRVILVEADLHKHTGEGRSRGAGMSPAAAVGAGDEHAEGVTTVLAGGDLDDALLVVPVGDGDGPPRELIVLPSGPTPPNPSELLESGRMHDLMMELERRCDIVVYDTPALTAVSDALALLPDTAGVIVVGRLHHTSRDTIRECLSSCRCCARTCSASSPTAPSSPSGVATTTTAPDAGRVRRLRLGPAALRRPLAIAAIAVVVVLVEVAVGSGLTGPQSVRLLALMAAVAGMALAFRFPLAVAIALLLIAGSLFHSAYFTWSVGPVQLHLEELVLLALGVVAVVAPKRQTWGGAAGVASPPSSPSPRSAHGSASRTAAWRSTTRSTGLARSRSTGSSGSSCACFPMRGRCAGC